MNILIMGPAGAGKGTMSERIAAKYGIPHISSGDMFRNEISGKTELGLAAQGYIAKGELVPDEVTIGMVRNRLCQPDCRQGYLLDGFPRTLAQAKALARMTGEMGIPLDLILQLEIDFAELSRRISGRRTCPKCGAIYNIYTKASSREGICDVCGSPLRQRSDDTEEGLRQRLAEYERQTVPVLEHFAGQGLIRTVAAGRGIDEVWADVQKALEGKQ